MFLPQNPFFKYEYFGLAINNSAARAIAINSDKSVKSYSQVALNPAVFDHGVIDKNTLTQSLKTLKDKGNFSSGYAAITIPDIYSFSRLHTLPKIAFDEVSEAINWQIEKIFPLPKKQIYFDWKLIGQKEKKLTILVVALRKKLIDDIVDILNSIGIKPISFEPTASALTRILKSQPDQPSILIELNPSGSSSTLIENNLSSLTVTNRFEISSDSNLILQKTNQSIQELVNFYISRNAKPQKPFYAFLTGESATQLLATWLTSYLNIQVKLLQIPNVPPQFHQAYAAASTSILPPKSHLSINLLPSKLQATYDAHIEYNKLTAAVKISFIALFLGLVITAASLINSMLAINQTNSQLAQLQASTSQFNYDSSQIATVNKNSLSLVKLFPLKSTPVDKISEMFLLTPPAVNISSFTYSKKDNTISVVGNAQTRAQLLLFKDNLKNSSHFLDVKVPLESLEKSTNVDFSIEITLQNDNQSITPAQ